MDIREILFASVDWINVSQNMDQWRALTHIVMNLCVIWNFENFLSYEVTTGFWRNIRLHGESYSTLMKKRGGQAYLLLCNACHYTFTKCMDLLLHTEHIWDSVEDWTWLWCSNWHFVLSVECGMVLKKERKAKFSGLSLQNVLRRTVNESQKNRRARKEEKAFQRYTVNLKHLHHAILDNVHDITISDDSIHGILFLQTSVPRSVLYSCEEAYIS